MKLIRNSFSFNFLYYLLYINKLFFINILKTLNNINLFINLRQLAYLSKINYIDLVITEDSDLIAFGAKKIFYKMD
jgi:hypothetical protein